MKKSQAFINPHIDRMKAEYEETVRRNLALEQASQDDPIDQRLRAIIARYRNSPVLYGVSGSAEMMTRFTSPAWYKGKAAAHLLRVRTLRRWHEEFKGKPYTDMQLLQDASFCRRRAAGLEPMPNVEFVGG